MHWYPLRFEPIYQERVWGGRSLESRLGRSLPSPQPFGESWEITDRPDAQSRVASGPLAGKTLAELMAADPAGLLGDASPRAGRFPLLVKVLDARETLSLQVHPPAHLAAHLGGEPKTEMWYFVASDPGAEILVGLRQGTTRQDFEAALRNGTVAQCFHRVPIQPGDAMFLPSGRVHAIGAGLLLFEIQENSDTTYRVFDWNRVGLDGRPRPLHIDASLASIDFTDYNPNPVATTWRFDAASGIEVRDLVQDPLFGVEARRCASSATENRELPRCTVIGVARGSLEITDPNHPLRLGPGGFCLLPAGLGRVLIQAEPGTEWLVAEPGTPTRRPSPPPA